MNLEPKPEEARGSKVGEMMPGRISSIPNSSESSTSGSFFTSIPTPATATTIDTTPPKLSTEPRFCVKVDTSDTLWRLYGRSTDFPVQTVKPKRTRYVYHPAPPRTCFHEACKAVRGRIGPTLHDSDAAGRVWGKSWPLGRGRIAAARQSRCWCPNAGWGSIQTF